MSTITPTATAPARRSLLHTALQLDAAVTGANGLAYVALAGPLGDLFGLSSALLRGAGVFLLAFAACVALLATRPVPARPAVLAVIGANAVWVLDSVVAAIAGWGSPDTPGTVWMLLQAAVVAGFAALQLTALRRRG